MQNEKARELKDNLAKLIEALATDTMQHASPRCLPRIFGRVGCSTTIAGITAQ